MYENSIMSEEEQALLWPSEKKFLCPYCSTYTKPRVHEYKTWETKRKCFYRNGDAFPFLIEISEHDPIRNYTVKIRPDRIYKPEWIRTSRIDIQNARINGAVDSFVALIEEYIDIRRTMQSIYSEDFNYQVHQKDAIAKVKDSMYGVMDPLEHRRAELDKILKSEIRPNGYLRLNEPKLVEDEDFEFDLLRDAYKQSAIGKALKSEILLGEWNDQGCLISALMACQRRTGNMKSKKIPFIATPDKCEGVFPSEAEAYKQKIKNSRKHYRTYQLLSGRDQ